VPFWCLREAAGAAGAEQVSGVLFDLGVSSRQIDDPERGFSYRQDGPLDMRMGPDAKQTAADVVNGYSEPDLLRVLREYGEERQAGRIVRALSRRRQDSPLLRTDDLRQVVVEATTGPHPQKCLARVFQAVRIEVNGELALLGSSLEQAADLLVPGGRVVVLSYHSLEDRIVKNVFRNRVKGCTCPPDFPVCRCGFVPTLRLVTRRSMRAQEAEVAKNPRSRSASLRAAGRLPS